MTQASLLRPTRKTDAKELRDLVLEAGEYKNIASGSAQGAANSAMETAADRIATGQDRVATESAKGDAVAIVYGGGYSTEPAPGNVPIAGSSGTVDKDWIAAEYSIQLIEHIGYAMDILGAIRKDVPSNRDTDALVQMLLQIADLSGQAAKTLSGVGEYKASAGSAARCSIAHHANPGTGVFFPADDEIAFAVGGVEVLRIDSSGIV